jgi:glutathione S-transferase
VASRFRTYLPDLSRWGDDGTAQTYVEALFALPAMTEWEKGARAQIEAARLSRQSLPVGPARP